MFLDPGKHTVRFTSGGKDQTVTLVVGTGEQGRTVIATFSMINAATRAPAGDPVVPRRPASPTSRRFTRPGRAS